MLTQNIRRQFIQYFKSQGHSSIISSPVIPQDDPTLLFANAGMNQFKDVFLGSAVRDYKRAVTCQKCIRAGGKHNDLDNVGHTSRHLTFFEMLGNFSFGNYFKREAIQFAWEVSTQVFGFDPDRIWPSVFREDDEAFELWTKYVPASRITRLDEKDNFWEMGDTGPCGPCSELYFDKGPAFGTANKLIEDTTGERFLEFWNLVFMQYNRQSGGVLTPLPNPSIDTGAGLERVIALKMGVESVFLTDVFQSIIQRIEEVSGVSYNFQDQQKAPAFHVIADHLRSLSFAIADGAQPSNIERGYVLRKILRRATRYARLLGIDKPFLGEVLPRLVETMGSDYPELVSAQQRIAEVLYVEEEAFLRTLQRGGNMLNQVVQQAEQHHHLISGEDAFKLKDTYGLPIEEILLFAKDNHFTVDLRKYEDLEKEARERSRRQQKTTQLTAEKNKLVQFVEKHGETIFTGYQEYETTAKVVGILQGEEFVNSLEEGQEAVIFLDKTPFYAEMGGQVGDQGLLVKDGSTFVVTDCQAPFKGLVSHIGLQKQGTLRVGDEVEAQINRERRQAICYNHTATHLLHWALKQVLGTHVRQAGSVVGPDYLRFDFSHHKALLPEELIAVEKMINQKISQNNAVITYELPYQEVQQRPDIQQIFGDKYGNTVRVVDIEGYSKELCGGTHSPRTGNIGLFVFVKEGSIAAGVRRIEAFTGQAAIDYLRGYSRQIHEMAEQVKVKPTQLQERLNKLLEENKALSQEVKKLRQTQLQTIISDLTTKVEKVNGMPTLIAEVDLGQEELRQVVEDVMNRLKSAVVVLGIKENERCHLLIRVSDDLAQKGIQAGQLVKIAAPVIEGSGGGKPTTAQAGGKAPHKLKEALETVKEHLKA